MRRSFLFSPTYCLVLCALLRAADSPGQFVNLGPQVTATTIQGSAFVRDPTGKDLIYTVVRGEPGHLLGYEVATGNKIYDAAIPGADGSWTITASSDGFVYLPGASHLFRHRPGSGNLEDLGRALPSETLIWDVTAGADGEIFGATYPGCRVFRFSPKDGFSDVGSGPLVEGENYVRCVAYHAASGKVYAGVGSHAHLIELDPKTGEKTELLADQVKGQEAVYSLGITPAEDGDRLLAWVTNRNQTLVYNLKTRQIERELPTQAIKSAIKAPDGPQVYCSDGNDLISFDLDRPGDPPRRETHCIGTNATQWIESDTLCILTRYAQLLSFHPSTGKCETLSLQIPPQPIPIQSMQLGPDGRIWMGGFLAGGTAVYDPATGESRQYKGMSQIERIGVLGQKLYFGVYPHARIYEFDPANPWDVEHGNPRQIAKVEGQSRPIAVLGVPQLSKVFIGMVPEYGILGGHLMEYDPATEKLTDHGEAVEKQSVVSLVYAGEMIVGGTSVTGGLGIPPQAKEACLFGWDPRTNSKSFQLTPVPGAAAITCLIIGPDKKVWGIADGTLFVFDPAARQIESTTELFPVHYDDRHVWRDGFLLQHRSGQLYGTLAGKFFRLDPATKKVFVLRDEPASLLAIDATGRLYFRDKINLWQYSP